MGVILGIDINELYVWQLVYQDLLFFVALGLADSRKIARVNVNLRQ